MWFVQSQDKRIPELKLLKSFLFNHLKSIKNRGLYNLKTREEGSKDDRHMEVRPELGKSEFGANVQWY